MGVDGMGVTCWTRAARMPGATSDGRLGDGVGCCAGAGAREEAQDGVEGGYECMLSADRAVVGAEAVLVEGRRSHSMAHQQTDRRGHVVHAWRMVHVLLARRAGSIREGKSICPIE